MTNTPKDLAAEMERLADVEAEAAETKRARARADVHTVASEVYKGIAWGSQATPPPHGAAYPSYTRYGNSDAETEARAIAGRILAALEPAPDRGERQAYIEGTQAGWDAAIEAAIVHLKVYPLHQEDTGPKYVMGYAAGYHTALNRVSALKKGTPQ